MQLWQLDLVGGVFLAGGRECKLLTGIDDHSRFMVLATVLAIPSGRAVAEAFVAAMRVYGVPSEVLTDNGKQFTGRFTKPRPAEVLFERVCRENGIIARLTRPYSPTTTGKIERFHRTLRRELLDVVGPFADLPAAQAAIDAWIYTYNNDRPHQGLDMALPASLFRPNDPGPIAVIVPSKADRHPALPAQAAGVSSRPAMEEDDGLPLLPAPPPARAVEFDTVIIDSGILNVLAHVQRIKMGTARAGQRAHVWADDFNVHIVIDGELVKTAPSNLSAEDLDELLMRGARPAGPPPQPKRPKDAPAGSVYEVQRNVDVDGFAGLAAHQLKIGPEFALQPVTLRLDGPLVHVIHNSLLIKTLPSPVPADQRTRVIGSRLATGPLPPAAVGPLSVQRRVPTGGVVMVTRQRLRVGHIHAGKTVTIHVEDTYFRVTHNGEELSLHPRREQRPVRKFREQAPRPHLQSP